MNCGEGSFILEFRAAVASSRTLVLTCWECEIVPFHRAVESSNGGPPTHHVYDLVCAVVLGIAAVTTGFLFHMITAAPTTVDNPKERPKPCGFPCRHTEKESSTAALF